MGEAVERAVRLWILTKSDDDLSFVIQEIQNGSASLVDLVKILGPYLTSEEAESRVNGVELLVEIISKLPDTSFTRQSTRVINAFLITKLDTVDEVVPALRGLLRLSSMTTYAASDCREAVEQLFKLHMKAHIQSTRHLVLLLVDSFMTRHRSVLQSLGPVFLKGYISLVENEKDPRNLLVAFALDRVILLEFDVSEFVEQFYDITFCYFPITFKAPPNDPYGVTGPDLIVALRNCLSASPLLGPLGMPLFIEKLNVGTAATKKDTLATIAVCLPVYGKVVAENTAHKLWDGLKIEIFQPVDVEVQNAALGATKTLVQTCHPRGSKLEGISQRILKTCLEQLNEPSTSQGQIAVKVIATLIETSDEIASQVVQEVIPKLMGLYEASSEMSTRASILTALASMLGVSQMLASSTADSPSPLFKYKESMLSLFVSAIKTPSTAQQGSKGLHQLILSIKLEQEELKFVIHSLVKALLESQKADEELIQETLAVLQTLSKLSPSSVEDVALLPLFSLLPDKPPREDEIEVRTKCVDALAALETICVQQQLFFRLVVHLFTKVELLVLTQREGEVDTMIAYAHALLKTIHSALLRKSDRGDVDIPKYLERFIPRLYFLFFDALGRDGISWGENYKILISDAADIIELVVASSKVERQEIWVNALVEAFSEGKPSSLTIAHAPTPAIPQFRPLEINENQSYDSLVPLFTAGIVGLHAETRLPFSDLNEMLGGLVNLAATSESAEKRRSVGRLVSSILNKHANECTKFIDVILKQFWATHIMNEKLASYRRVGSLELWASAVQALIVRHHPSSVPLARQLFLLFDDSLMAAHAGKTLGQMPNLKGSPLNQNCHAVIRLLHAQRLFNAFTPGILEGFSSANFSTKSIACLTAVSNLVSSVPKTTTSPVINTLFPLMLRGLELPDLELRANITECLVMVVDGEGMSRGIDAITSHLGTLVPRLLRNTRVDRHVHASVRLKVGSIRFLASLPERLKQEDVQPYKAEVLRELQIALDDSSRIVRKEAVLARSRWWTGTFQPRSNREINPIN